MEPAIQSFNSWQIGEFDMCLLPLDSETQENCHRVKAKQTILVHKLTKADC